ncbi:hypothetical protein [Providencia hangzhouensis]|uniref:hypothetical protein n=1 Tax=Providencia hangzhouensis TaxID=3031799 RepID=UPI0034DCD7A0
MEKKTQMINVNDKKTNNKIINKDDDLIFLTEHIDGSPLVGEQSSELKIYLTGLIL